MLVACLLVRHQWVPNTVGRVGSLLETFLPWLGVTVPVLLAAAWCRRSTVAVLAALLPLAAWLLVFGGHLVPVGDPRYDITVVQHNVSDENPDPATTVRGLVHVRPDLVALQEVTPAELPTWTAALAAQYPHHTVHGTVGLWSRYPLAASGPVDIRPHGVGADWNRGLRAVTRMPQGDVAVYVAHLPSVRLGLTGLGSARRDESAALLGAAIAAEPVERVILLGDLNGTVHDRALRPVTAQLTTARSDFAFSWPAGSPVARIDQVLGRSVQITHIWALPATGSDHLPVAARVRF